MLARRLLLLALSTLVTVNAQRGPVLRTLVETPCIQTCYILGCDDLDPRCVCAQLAATFVEARDCVQRQCTATNDTGAFVNLWDECTARSAELGVSMPSSPGEQAATPTSTATSSTAPTTSSTAISQDARTEPSMAPQSSSPPRRMPTTLIVAILAPVLAIAGLGIVAFLFLRRRRQNLRRLSINTFMDQSEAQNPNIGAPMHVQHEKLPPALNDLLTTLAPKPQPPPRRPQDNPFRDPAPVPRRLSAIQEVSSNVGAPPPRPDYDRPYTPEGVVKPQPDYETTFSFEAPPPPRPPESSKPTPPPRAFEQPDYETTYSLVLPSGEAQPRPQQPSRPDYENSYEVAPLRVGGGNGGGSGGAQRPSVPDYETSYGLSTPVEIQIGFDARMEPRPAPGRVL